MALDTIEQIHTLLEQKQHILITFRKGGKGDAIASAVALKQFLETFGKHVDIVSDGFMLPNQYQFLTEKTTIDPDVAHLQQFIINVDIKETGMENITYDIHKGTLHVCITPKRGMIEKGKLTTKQTNFVYDLIIVLNSRDLESLGQIYHKNAELFYKTPILNIDHHPANEHFGQINLVDITSSSTAEVLFTFMEQLGNECINNNIATTLLTGMIANTHSFKTPNVRPHTLVRASTLMSMGADRDTIVKHLYQTRSLPSLKLWGQALANIKHHKDHNLVTTSITRDNFTRSGAEEHELHDIVDELISSSPEAKIIVLLHEHAKHNEEGLVHGIVKARNPYDAKLLVNTFRPKGDENIAHFSMKHTPLHKVEEQITDHIKKVTSVIHAS